MTRTPPGGRAARRAIVFALTGTLVVGAAPLPLEAANREHLQMMSDIRMLQEQAQHLQLLLASVTETLKALNARLDEQAEANRKAFADQRLQTAGVTGDLRVLREKMDDTNVRLASLAQEVEALRVSVPVAPAAVPATATAEDQGATPPVESPAPPPVATPLPPSPGAGMSPQRLFETAYADYASGQWGLAVQGFEAFIKTFPRSEQADDAQFYIGEAYQLDGRFDQAVTAYDRVVSGYPSSEQVPLALYKRGLAQMRLGQADRARDSWDTVVKKYPESDAAVLAKQGLDRLARTRR